MGIFNEIVAANIQTGYLVEGLQKKEVEALFKGSLFGIEIEVVLHDYPEVASDLNRLMIILLVIKIILPVMIW
jgi:hypothetical protein